MDFELTEADRRWQKEVRDFLKTAVTDGLRECVFDGHEQDTTDRHLIEEFEVIMAEKGWHAASWPKEYGGLGLSAIAGLILMQELAFAGAPNLEDSVTALAPIIIRHGTETNKKMWLDKIAKREVTFTLGYSEPDAGTDLASLKTRAVLDGDEWVISGTKIWNSYAHRATHEWMLVRTSPDLPKHRGLSLIIVPLSSAGIEVSPIYTWGDIRTNQVFFTDVRVPKNYLIGEQDRGWNYIVGALDYERMVAGFSEPFKRFLSDLVNYCEVTRVDGLRIIDRSGVREKLAELAIEVDLVNLLSWEIADTIDRGEIPTIAATTQKIMSSELRTKLSDFGLEVCGPMAQIRRGDYRSPINGDMDLLYRRAPVFRFAGGTNEVMRDIVAQRGLGMPRSRRGLANENQSPSDHADAESR